MKKVLVVEQIGKEEIPTLLGLYANWDALRKDYPQTAFMKGENELMGYWVTGNQGNRLTVIEWTVYE
jgi:hypothetical protein